MNYKRIGLDTNVLIYYIEEHPYYRNGVQRGKKAPDFSRGDEFPL
ncbi:MAG: hypothetical protein WA144_07225 [Candidatus Methanoperedens sp.]